MSLWVQIAQHLTARTGRPFELQRCDEATGGCINRSMVVQGQDGRRYFVKLNRAERLSMFEAEAGGLSELGRAQATGGPRVPQTVCTGSAEGQAYLVLEYLPLVPRGSATDELLGRQLATLHRLNAERYGWHAHNTLGSTPQDNAWCDDWVEFYRTRRLQYQLGLAAARSARSLQHLGDQLLARLPAFFSDYRPVASLLHGDLWSGNAAATTTGEAAIFDPAVYFGDRETDLAMTELFGGFSPRFYGAYRAAWPLDAGYSVRKTVYNLYHVLNHFNLFGGGYGAQAEQMMQQLLSEVR